MKSLPTLLMTTLLASTIATWPVLAADPSEEMVASSQESPSEISFAKDMQEDEQLAKSTPSDNGVVQYISGGVAESGMRAIDAEEHFYNLKMLFASEGEYLANVRVNITSNKGKNVLSATTQGPVLLVRMPPGRYTVNTVAEDGSTLSRHVEVNNDHLASYVLRYPASEQ